MLETSLASAEEGARPSWMRTGHAMHGNQRPRNTTNVLAFVLVVVGVTLGIGWFGPKRQNLPQRKVVWEIGNGRTAYHRAETHRKDAYEASKHVEEEQSNQGTDGATPVETEAWELVPSDEEVLAPTTTEWGAPASMAVETVDFNRSTYRGVPVLVQEKRKAALLSPSMVLERKTDEVSSSEWILSQTLDPDQFRQMARNVYNTTASIPELLRTSAGYFFDATRPQVTNIAYLKTHKTGSTTLGSVFYRYGARHHLKFYVEGHILNMVQPKAEKLGKYNIILQHHSGDGFWHGGRLHNDYQKLLQWYQALIQDPSVVTILREPVSHYLSSFYYYHEPDMRAKKKMQMEPDDHPWLWESVEAKKWKNPMAAEFGIYSTEALSSFLETGLPSFSLIMLTDRFEESLVVMRHLFNLNLLDLTFLTLNEGLEGRHRYDKKLLKSTPHPQDLDPTLVEKIQDITKADAILYDRAAALFDEKVESLKREGVDVDAEVEALHDMNKRLAEACQEDNKSKTVQDICSWYELCDSCYERRIDDQGHGPIPEVLDDLP